MAKAKRVIEGWDNGRKDFWSVDDVANAIVNAINNDEAASLYPTKESCALAFSNSIRRRITITVEDAKPKARKAKR